MSSVGVIVILDRIIDDGRVIGTTPHHSARLAQGFSEGIWHHIGLHHIYNALFRASQVCALQGRSKVKLRIPPLINFISN